MNTVANLIEQLHQGNVKALARCITYVENEIDGYEAILARLQFQKDVPVIGITGPPGAGKSTLINQLIRLLAIENKKIGIVAIDPTSPFNYGSLLGDRLRMVEHFTNENVFIRSLATRGSLGGLSAKTIEIVDTMRAFGFDYIFVETVGVGQSEVEIAGLADITVLVLVPESGDEIQTLKSGIMEIADIFVVNKADREGANTFMKNLQGLLHLRHISSPFRKGEMEKNNPIIIKTIAEQGEGIDQIIKAIKAYNLNNSNDKRIYLLAEKAYSLIQNYRMKDIDKQELRNKIETVMNNKEFNLYLFVKDFIERKFFRKTPEN